MKYVFLVPLFLFLNLIGPVSYADSYYLYQAMPGDSLSKVTAKFGLCSNFENKVEKIFKINKFKMSNGKRLDKGYIWAGQFLKIPKAYADRTDNYFLTGRTLQARSDEVEVCWKKFKFAKSKVKSKRRRRSRKKKRRAPASIKAHRKIKKRFNNENTFFTSLSAQYHSIEAIEKSSKAKANVDSDISPELLLGYSLGITRKLDFFQSFWLTQMRFKDFRSRTFRKKKYYQFGSEIGFKSRYKFMHYGLSYIYQRSNNLISETQATLDLSWYHSHNVSPFFFFNLFKYRSTRFSIGASYQHGFSATNSVGEKIKSRSIKTIELKLQKKISRKWTFGAHFQKSFLNQETTNYDESRSINKFAIEFVFPF